MTRTQLPHSPHFGIDRLYDHAPCGFIHTCPAGRITWANRRLLAWTKYAREELEGKFLRDVLTRAGQMFYDTHLSPRLCMEGHINEVALELLSRDGLPLPVLIHIVRQVDDTGVPILNQVAVFSVAERRQYEGELLAARRRAEEALEAKAALLATISHDVRNPLNVMLGALDLLAASELKPVQEECVDILASSTRTALHLVNQLLTFSRIEDGGLAVGEEPLDLRAATDELLAHFGIIARRKRLRLSAAIDPRLPVPLMLDPGVVRHVLANLLDNALKFTRDGSVTLKLHVRDAAREWVDVQFLVCDTGIGIPAQFLDRVFDQFTKLKEDVDMAAAGAGLGLTIAKRVLDGHGSRIEVHSRPGSGSTFSFVLRCRRCDPN